MDALDLRHEDIRFVWTVYFSIYALRTDATFFCAADVPYLNYDAPVLYDYQLYPVRYCRDMIALDLGHMWIEDLSFLYNMPKLQYLILVGGRFRDITPIGSLQELKYLEIFQTNPADISPLLNYKKLEQLNMCYCFGFDLSPLKEMKQLKRLWFVGLGPYRGAEIAEALPDRPRRLDGRRLARGRGLLRDARRLRHVLSARRHGCAQLKTSAPIERSRALFHVTRAPRVRMPRQRRRISGKSVRGRGLSPLPHSIVKPGRRKLRMNQSL